MAKVSQVIDPVCGMTVDPMTAAAEAQYKGETYYFCNKGCAAKFEAGPENFLKRPSPGMVQLQRQGDNGAHSEHPTNLSSSQPTGVEYTCPMHPQIVQIGPGTCPICGMALEPKV